MEVVGVVASVVTLAQLVIEGVKLAKTLYAAPDDLAALQEQLENFNSLVQEIDRSQGEGTDGIITQSLTRAKLSIEQLHQLIQIKLLKNLNGGTSRARRRAWTRNKSKILALRDVLKECRDNLSVALSAKNSSFSAQTETSLAIIVQGTGQSRQSLNTIDTRLSEIQQSLVAAQKAIDAQSHSLGHILTSVSSSVTTGLFRQDGYQVVRPSRGGYFESVQNMPRYTNPPSPAGTFELSENFFPELYTISEGPSSVPMHVYSAFEEQSSALCRTNCYQFFFMQSQRQWRRLSLSLTIRKDSRFWDYTELSIPKEEFFPTSYCFPSCFQSRIEELIWSIEDLYHDTHLSLVVLEESAEESNSQEVSPRERFTVRTSKAARGNTEKDTILLLYHLGCQRYYEKEVVQIAEVSPSVFAVCVGEQILNEVKISATPEDSSLYTIQVLHCLRGCPGIAKFAGIVIDSSGQHVKSYLREIPLKGWMFSIITDAIDQDSNVAWNRRERWAREIVEAVAQIHSRGFVAGVLGEFITTPIRIDGSDHAILSNFRNKTRPILDLPGYLPPELRGRLSQPSSLPRITARYEHQDVTPACDIFQLGSLLWLIASNQKPRWLRHICFYEQCDLVDGYCLKHINMIALPPLLEEVPKYYQDIIELCRLSDPTQRPPARKLLEMFPPGNEPMFEPEPKREAEKTLALRQIVDGFSFLRIFCDVCDEEALDKVFHCNVCSEGNYDLCLKCMNKGVHCRDPAHFLIEMTSKKGTLVDLNNYYSSVKADGKRDVVHL